MILYHGSKKGIKGAPSPYKSRKKCDFGQGMYLGNQIEQPQGLVAAIKDSVFYTLEYDMSDLKVKEFGNDYTGQIDWALFIAYNRDNQYFSGKKNLCSKYEGYNELYDIIIGSIADDSMIPTLTSFFNNNIPDKVMLESLKLVKLGNQYVLKTPKACDEKHLKIIESRPLTAKEIKMAIAQAEQRRDRMASELERIQRKYRRDNTVKYFDEILEEWDR